MPEIVDLEVMRRNMLKKVERSKITDLEVEEKVLRNCAKNKFKEILKGETLQNIDRLAKQLIFEFNNDISLVVHLMLHGDFCWFDDSKDDNEKNVVLKLDFGNGDIVLLKDWSRWTKVEIDSPEHELDSELLNKDFGVDPLSDDFTLNKMKQILEQKSRSYVRSMLMDQSVIAGIGNAYTDEILFDAGIHPKSKCKGVIEKGYAEKLYNSIVKVINESIDKVMELSGGEDISEQERDFMKVYRKSGQKCPRCEYMISQLKVSNRDTFVCEKCQELL